MPEILNDKYEIITTINKGSYGVVSLVKDISSGEHYAAKCISKHRPDRSRFASLATNRLLSENPSDNLSNCTSNYALSDAQSIIDGRYEIQVHNLIGKHPNIVSLVDHFELDDNLYLILEYCTGGDLYEAIRSGGDIFYPHQRIRDLMNQLIDVVEFCHGLNIYHRDIKPENILISADGLFKLTDWGLATSELNCTEFEVGSRQYMAPECFGTTAESYNAAAADIWALGICLLNVLFERNPFKVANQSDRLFTDFAASRESLFDIFPSMSQDVFAVLRHCLTIDPQNRSLSGMRKALAEVRIWSTEEEFELIASDNEFEPPEVDVMNITTEADRPPLRVPTALGVSLTPIKGKWDLRMQFTPPVSRADFHLQRPSRCVHDRLTAGSILEEDENFLDQESQDDRFDATSSGRTQLTSDDHSLDSESSHEHDDSIFCMDDLSRPLSDISDPSTQGSPALLIEKSLGPTESVAGTNLPVPSTMFDLDFGNEELVPRSWADEDEAFSQHQSLHSFEVTSSRRSDLAF
ncbi:Serine/threonine-protein kinase KSP1 [Wickerhamiella sorbophila]|uniref:Serine/threonine-protein kinase KSP1 n=1 Tax=Wickerhamiella sorbophila TaxID=45607 RepID=A0A2T0FC43_9ASCO|nr:Serine/threonine-protein kinase KSP1 [Wickerhamiella sorbophila]PRT52537.1 Serine/threonine-protein kinase KSP1 [Wickerhamiella sorbophila]